MAITYTSMAQNTVNLAQAQAYAGASTGTTASSSYSSGLSGLSSIYSGLTSGTGTLLNTSDTGSAAASLLSTSLASESFKSGVITQTLDKLNSPTYGSMSDTYNFSKDVLSGFYT